MTSVENPRLPDALMSLPQNLGHLHVTVMIPSLGRWLVQEHHQVV
jgi:hypothetical protein